MRPRTITLLLVLSMLALPVAAYGYQTAVLDEPVFAAADDDVTPVAEATRVRQRLQVHDPENPIDDPAMTQQRLHATTAQGTPGGNYDQATHQQTQDRDQPGAMSGTAEQAQQQQRLQVHDPENPIDDPLMTQQRLQAHDGQAGQGHGAQHGAGRGMLGANAGTCDGTGDCPND